jgi:CubicO group peptidase (beta-lactamase class C family)
MRVRAEKVNDLRRRVLDEIDSGHLPSAQFALALDGDVVVTETLGDAPSNARYCIFSATKALVASVVWQLIGEGRLDPAEPVASYWPGFGTNGKQHVTLEHVMLHTAGFPMANIEGDAADRATRVAAMENWTLAWEPGTRYVYHPATAHWVLAELIDLVTGSDYRLVLRDRILDPLGLDRLELGVPVERQGDVQHAVHTGEAATPEEIKEAIGIDLPPVLAGLDVTAMSRAGPAMRFSP